MLQPMAQVNRSETTSIYNHVYAATIARDMQRKYSSRLMLYKGEAFGLPANEEREFIRRYALEILSESEKLALRIDDKGSISFDLTEAVILDMIKCSPSCSYQKIALKMREMGQQITDSKVRYVLERKGLDTREARFRWVYKLVNQRELTINQEKWSEIERFFRQRDVLKVKRPSTTSEQLAHKLFRLGKLAGLGTVYVHVWLDIFSGREGFAHAVTSKAPDYAAGFFAGVIIPCYGALGKAVREVITDASKELHGHVDTHDYAFTLKATDVRQYVDHSKKCEQMILLKDYFQGLMVLWERKGLFDREYDNLRELNDEMLIVMIEHGLTALDASQYGDEILSKTNL